MSILSCHKCHFFPKCYLFFPSCHLHVQPACSHCHIIPHDGHPLCPEAALPALLCALTPVSHWVALLVVGRHSIQETSLPKLSDMQMVVQNLTYSRVC